MCLHTHSDTLAVSHFRGCFLWNLHFKNKCILIGWQGCNILKAPQYVAFTCSKKQNKKKPASICFPCLGFWLWWLLKRTISCYWLTLGLKVLFGDANLLLGGQRDSEENQTATRFGRLTEKSQISKEPICMNYSNRWLLLYVQVWHTVTKPTTASFSVATFSCYIPSYTTKVMWWKCVPPDQMVEVIWSQIIQVVIYTCI